MTTTGAELPTSDRPTSRVAFLALLRAALSVAALGAAYFLVPTRSGDGVSDWPWLILAMCVFGVIVGIQVPAITRARYPVLRAVETLAILIPVYLVIFARIYLSTSLADASAFNEPLSTVTALYFTVTVFASVGFGDIVAHSDSTRLVVTLQMLLNLVVIGLVVRLLLGAAQRGVTRKRQSSAAESSAAEKSAARSREDEPGTPVPGDSGSAHRHGWAPEPPGQVSPQQGGPDTAAGGGPG